VSPGRPATGTHHGSATGGQTGRLKSLDQALPEFAGSRAGGAAPDVPPHAGTTRYKEDLIFQFYASAHPVPENDSFRKSKLFTEIR
jgi:hypothetical protein